MKKQNYFILIAILLMIVTGCKKSSESPDYASNSTGVYTGIWVVPSIGQIEGTCEIIKVTTTTVNVKMTAGSQPTPTVPGAKLSDGGSGTVNIKYTDSSGTLNGTIKDKTINLTLTAGSITETFTGTRP